MHQKWDKPSNWDTLTSGLDSLETSGLDSLETSGLDSLETSARKGEWENPFAEIPS